MRIVKIIGIALAVILAVLTVLFTIYFLFANEGYGIDILSQLFEDGVLAGIKNFFIDIWNGFKYVFKA
ncbi:MAG: hypothetical protein IJX17_04890 [Clostridia bacterium]|nr:hypothetical protein [Clostridia bacterium]